MNERDLIDRLRVAQWPSPSAQLRARIAATLVEARPIPLADRLWYSRAWRVGMAAAATCLIVLNLWPARGPGAQLTSAEADTEAVKELAQSAGFPEEAAAQLARRALIASRPPSLDRTSLFPGEGR